MAQLFKERGVMENADALGIQAVTDEALRPGIAPADCLHFEFEGDDRKELLPLPELL